MKKTTTMVFLYFGLCVFAQNSERQKYYFKKRMNEVKNSISIDKAKEQELYVTYNDLCIEQPNEEAELLFKIAMHKAISDSTKILAVCETEISKAVAQRLSYKLEFIKIRKQLTDEQLKTIEPIVVEKEKAFRRLDYLYPNLIDERIKAENRINENYSQKIETAYAQMGIANWLSNYASALKYINELSLKTSQINQLCELAIKLSHDFADNKNYSLRLINEHNNTKTILSKVQYDRFLECKVKNKVQAELQKSWNEMKKYNMSAEVDSVTVNKILLPFYTERAIITERYNNIENGEEQKQIQLENLNTMTPAILKKLSAVKNREKKKTALQPNALSW